jgi:Xaa-Pro aminopeptidase
MTLERLTALRSELARREVDGFLIPLADEFQSEFPPESARRLEWLTGFSGSAGIAVVLGDKAAIFVDGRYMLQVREQIDTDLFDPLNSGVVKLSDWIADNAQSGAHIGYDPWLHTPDGLARMLPGCVTAGATLVPLDPNPLDAVWIDRPAPPLAPLEPHKVVFAGRTSRDKIDEVAAMIAKNGAAAAVLATPDTIAWLLNIRGGDLPTTPVSLCYAILWAKGDVQLFVDDRKLTPESRAHLHDVVSLHALNDLGPVLALMGAEGLVVQAGSGGVPCWITTCLEAAGADIVNRPDPCILPRACKNSVELQGTRNAHIRDGAALCNFLAWLAEAAPAGGVTEITAAERLYEFRAGGEFFKGLSFDTISGAGSNGAIVHYRVTPESNKTLESGTLYLVDSGAQYLDGTTDVTRTVAIGEPTAEMRDCFTRVLQGHIAIATARFPVGTSGGQLDTLARLPLWRAGLDFDHGTGHGVGSYLGVHEGPQRIAKRMADVPLKPGMIVSNEPGYYKAGHWGIRIENLEVVRAAAPDAAAEREMLEFEALTLAPVDLSLVDLSLMTKPECDWLNAYHRRVREAIAPLVDDATSAWLIEATRAI